MAGRNHYVYALIGAPCDPASDEISTGKIAPRISLDPDSREKSLEERAASHLAGVEKDLATMRQFFGRGQDIDELFSYNHVDAQGKEWLVEQLRQAFGRTDVHAFFVYYTGHGYGSDGAWYLGPGRNNRLAPADLFRLWQQSLSGQSGESVLIIISDSCYSGHWVAAAERAETNTIAVQSATDQKNKSFDDEKTGGMFTYKVYNRCSHVFQSVFSVTGFFTAFGHGVWMICKEAARLFQSTEENALFPQFYMSDQFKQIMSRRGGTIQPWKVINNGRFLLIDTFEWIMFR